MPLDLYRLLNDPGYDPAADILPRGVDHMLDPADDPAAQFMPKLPFDPVQHNPRPPAAFPSLPDEERDGVMSQLLGSTMGGLQYAAETLDKPGRAVRGLLGGNPRELLNMVVPFSDTLGVTDPKTSTSGRDLLEKVGIAGPNQEGLDAADVGGFALDLLLDPTMYVGLGELGLAGKGAAKAGTVAKSIKPITTATSDLMKGVKVAEGLAPELAQKGFSAARAAGAVPDLVSEIRALTPEMLDAGKKFDVVDNILHVPGEATQFPLGPNLSSQIDQGQASLARLSVPFTNIEKRIGTGPGAVEFAGKYIDPAMDYLKYGNPVSRTLGGMFETDRMGMASEAGQSIAAKQTSPGLRQAAYEQLLPLQKDLAEFKAAGKLTPDHVEAMRTGAEMMGRDAAGVAAKYGNDPSLMEAAQYGNKLRETVTKGIPERLRKLGIPAEDLADNVVDHAFRFHHPEEWDGAIQKIFSDGVRLQEMVNSGRLDFLKNIQGGTGMINDLISDPRTWPLPAVGTEVVDDAVRKQAADSFAKAVEHVQQFVKPTVINDPAWKTLTPDRAAAALKEATDAAANEQATKFVSWVQSLDRAKYVDGGAKFFNGNLLEDAVLGVGRAVKQEGRANLAHDIIKETGKRFATAEEAAAAGYVPVTDALKTAKLTHNQPVYDVIDEVKQLAGGGEQTILRPQIAGFEGANATAAQRLGLDPMDVVQKRVVKEGGKVGTKTSIRDLENWYVPADAAADIGRFAEAVKPKSAALETALKYYDAGLNLWRETATRIWPGFHARNFLGGLFYNATSEANPGLQAYKMARDIRSGALSNPAIEAELRASGVWRKGTTAAGEQLGAPMAGNAAAGVVGTGGMLQGMKQSLAESAQNIASAPGIMGKAIQPIKELSSLGGQAGNFSEDVLRIAHYLGMKEKGYSPVEAAASVKKWLFDFGDLTPVEREGFRRVFPFFSFAKNNLKLVASELLRKPGGALGQTVRAINAPRQDGGFIPDYVSEGVAIPLPGGVPGGRYLTNLGLPIESAFDTFASGPTFKRSLERNLQGVLGQTSPLIKGVATAAFGIDPFTGRDLNELYKFPTQSPTANLIANSVAGTPLSKARTVLDERKGLGVKALNLLTGAHITDISGGPDRARQLAARKLDEEMMRESPHLKEYSRFYVPPDQKGNLTPQEISYLRLQETLAREARAVKKQPGNHLPKG